MESYAITVESAPLSSEAPSPNISFSPMKMIQINLDGNQSIRYSPKQIVPFRGEKLQNDGDTVNLSGYIKDDLEHYEHNLQY